MPIRVAAHFRHLLNCILTNNNAYHGGGACSNTLVNCALSGISRISKSQQWRWRYLLHFEQLPFAGNDSWGAGGGAAFSTLTGCTVSNNTANVGGGGLCTGFAINCVISSNQTMNIGGGAYSNTLVNCVLKNNLAEWHRRRRLPERTGQLHGHQQRGFRSVRPTDRRSGLYGGSATNCIIYYNLALKDPNCLRQCSHDLLLHDAIARWFREYHQRTAFLNLAGGDFHLAIQLAVHQFRQQCLCHQRHGLGRQSAHRRRHGGHRRLRISNAGQQNFLRLAPAIWPAHHAQHVDTADLDGTGFNVYQDWIAGLNPTNALSVLAMLPPVPTNNPAGLGRKLGEREQHRPISCKAAPIWERNRHSPPSRATFCGPAGHEPVTRTPTRSATARTSIASACSNRIG